MAFVVKDRVKETTTTTGTGTITLAGPDSRSAGLPRGSITSLIVTLAHISEAMDPEEDVLVLYTTSPYLFPHDDLEPFHRLRGRVRHALFGGDCYSYGLLASGHADIIVEAGLKPYDYAALVPVVEGAGGVITDWDGKPLTLASDGRVLAAGDARMHREALKVLHTV